MAQPDDIKQYGAADFDRYYSGQMTEQQKHALEKAALDDAFLAEAIEGYEGMHQKDWENQFYLVPVHKNPNLELK